MGDSIVPHNSSPTAWTALRPERRERPVTALWKDLGPRQRESIPKVPRRTNQFRHFAAATSCVVMLSGCVFGHGSTGSVLDAMPGSPMDDDATMAVASAPADHGLSPMDAFTVPPGTSERRGNVEISCPAGGPGCTVNVADDGTVRYETDGGTPSFMPVVPGTEEIGATLSGMLRNSNAPALARFAAEPPPPDAVTCAAVVIGCEGGLGPIHHRSVGKRRFPDFEFIERRRGVSLAERRQVSGDGDETTSYRALAGWLDHSFFLVETPGREATPGEHPHYSRYFGAWSIGAAAESNPDVSTGGTATWSGIMSGFRISDPHNFVHGDATITVSSPHDIPDLLVDVEFSNITDERTEEDFDDVSWRGMELKNGAFGVVPVGDDVSDASRHPARGGISGRFYGPNHEEVGGLFRITRSGADDYRIGGDSFDVSGVFGAKRD